MPMTNRPFGGLDDLRALGRVASAAWRANAPLVATTVGDVEWWWSSSDPATDFVPRVRLWEDARGVVAWGWFSRPAELDHGLHPDLAPEERTRVLDELLAWAEEAALAGVDASPGDEPPTELVAYAMDALPDEVAELTQRGFVPADEPFLSHFSRRFGPGTPELPPIPDLPAGYTLRHVRGADEIDARVAVHRAAFGTRRMTAEKYARVMAMDHYAPEHDLVVEAPDGSLVAFANVWWDPDGGVGELEPVGTHPDHQRRGLGLAVCRRALQLLRDLGARDALVFADATDPASNRLYDAAGFTRLSLHRRCRRPLPRRA